MRYGTLVLLFLIVQFSLIGKNFENHDYSFDSNVKVSDFDRITGLEIGSKGLISTVNNKNGEVLSKVFKVNKLIEKDLAFIAVGCNINFSSKFEIETGFIIHARNSFDGKKWNDWKEVSNDFQADSWHYSDLSFYDSKTNYLQFKIETRKLDPANEFSIKRIRFSIMNIEKSSEKSVNKVNKVGVIDNEEPKGKEVDLPEYVSRVGWGCDRAIQYGEDYCPVTLSTTTVTHLVIHHSSSNYPSSDYAAVVNTYYTWHTSGNGWSDIGYNWLVDPNGILYKGRAWVNGNMNVQGAHNSEKNSHTIGLNVIGNYDTYEPTENSITTLVEIAAFWADNVSIDPLGTAYHYCSHGTHATITGHKDCGGGTACPGANIVSKYTNIRNRVYDRLQAGNVTSVNLLEPENNVNISVTPDLIWEAFEDAINYNIQISENAEFSSFVIDETITETTYSVAEDVLSIENTYYWRVKANNADDWSLTRSFNTIEIVFENIWVKSISNSNLPAWFSSTSNAERGIAYYDNELFVVSRLSGLSVKIISAATGELTGTELSVTGITGGTFILNDIETSTNGEIFSSNLTLNSGSNAFKIYKWADKDSDPEVFLTYNEAAYRLGDNFTVVGNTNTNALIFAPVSSSNIVLRWEIVAGILNSTPALITLQGLTSLGSSPAVKPIGSLSSDNFYVNGSDISPTLFSATGGNLGAIDETVIGTGNNAFDFFTSSTNKYLYTLKKESNNDNNIILLDITSGLSNVDNDDIYGETDIIGSNENWNTGDVCTSFDFVNNKVILYVLSGNNGIGAYSPKNITGFSSGIEEENNYELTITNYELKQNYPNPFNPHTRINYELGIMNYELAEIVVYNAMGQKIWSTPVSTVETRHALSASNNVTTHGSIEFNGSAFNSGIYYYSLVIDGKKIDTKAMLLIK